MSDYRLLFKLLKESFSSLELETLCFELGYQPEEVFTATSITRRAQDLQEYARRRGHQQKLLQAIHDARPELDLTPYGGSSPGGGNGTTDSNDDQVGELEPADAISDKVFVSYKWGGDSEVMVDRLVPTLKENNVEIIRDKVDLGFKGLIKEFMQEIGAGDTVIVVLSDGYLKSQNCMFELTEIYDKSKEGVADFYERVIPIILPDAQIYDPLDRLDYLDYWSEKKGKLEARTRSAKGLQNINSITEAINLYDRIWDTIDHLMDMFGNMNALTADMHKERDFEDVLRVIEARVGPAK